MTRNHGTKEQRNEKANMDYGLIKDPGGFCVMWSYLQIDFRLGNPETPTDKLSNILYEKFKENRNQAFRRYIRKYTSSLVSEVYKKLGGLKELRDYAMEIGRSWQLSSK